MYTKAENNEAAPDAGGESEVDLLDVQLKVEESHENKDQAEKLFTANNNVPASDDVGSPPNDEKVAEFPQLED